MFEAQKYLATTKPASILISNNHFNIVIDDEKVTVYHLNRGISAVLHNADIKNLGVAKITLTASENRCAVSLANDKGYIEFQSISDNLVVSLFDTKQERLAKLYVKK